MLSRGTTIRDLRFGGTLTVVIVDFRSQKCIAYDRLLRPFKIQGLHLPAARLLFRFSAARALSDRSVFNKMAEAGMSNLTVEASGSGALGCVGGKTCLNADNVQVLRTTKHQRKECAFLVI